MNNVAVTPCLVDKHKNVLLLKRAFPPFAGYWGFPGGKVQESEAPEAALIREVTEEVGIEINKENIHGVLTQEFPGFVLINFCCLLTEIKSPILSNEHTESRIVRIKNLPIPLMPGKKRNH